MPTSGASVVGGGPRNRRGGKPRVARTVGRDSPVCCAMEWLETPWLANKITLHLRATLCGVVPARAQDSNCCF